MAKAIKQISVANLLLDDKNPRLERRADSWAQREIIQYLFDHEKALEVARSIATRGYFETEALLAIPDGRHHVVIEGNRRLAALKALKEPKLLTDKFGNQVKRLASEANLRAISNVPVVIAPNRRATDQLVSGRHIGTPVIPWRPENRASFILSKLEEGYSHNELRDELGFTEQNIQNARQTKAIADMARSLVLPANIKAKIKSRGKLSTIERVFDSPIGRRFLQVKTDPNHGLRGMTTKQEFLRAFQHLVTDIANGTETSRTLNTNVNIQGYFKQRNPEAVAAKKKGKFVPSDITGESVPKPQKLTISKKQSKKIYQTVIPKTFKVYSDNDRLVKIRDELVKLKRADFPNAGAVLLRVFLELAINDYLNRTNQMDTITKDLKKIGKLPKHGMPPMKILMQEITTVAQKLLKKTEATKVERALRYDEAAPFSISELNAFVHSTDFPNDRDIHQFWARTEPLFQIMLGKEPEDAEQ